MSKHTQINNDYEEVKRILSDVPFLTTAPDMVKMLSNWVDWYERQYGPLGLTPGRMLWEQTRDLLEVATGEPKKPLVEE